MLPELLMPPVKVEIVIDTTPPFTSASMAALPPTKIP
jgi:hypothetical protein